MRENCGLIRFLCPFYLLGNLIHLVCLVAQKKKVVDDLINSLEKLKVAVEEVKTDFTLSPTYEGEQLTNNETVIETIAIHFGGEDRGLCF